METFLDRKRIYNLLEPEGDEPPLDKAFNLFMMLLVVANVIAVVVETVPAVEMVFANEFAGFETFSVFCFTLEYVARAWSCVEDPRYGDGWKGRLRYLRSPLAIIDFLSILPSILAVLAIDLRVLRIFRVLRLFSMFKMMRYSQALRLLGRVFRHRREELIVTFALGGMLLLIAASIMYNLEHEAQPRAFESIPAALWWGVVTLATVGYGDVYPVTLAGRVFGGFVSVIGVGLFALPAGIIATGFQEELRLARGSRECPHCHGDLDAPPAVERVVQQQPSEAPNAYL